MSFVQWLAALKKSLTGAHNLVDWLTVGADNCLVCNGMIRGESQHDRTAKGLLYLRQSLCHRCRESIPWINRVECPHCGRDMNCEDCKRQPNRHFRLNRSAVAYDAVMRSWLAMYKYRGLERLGPALAEMLCPVYERLTEAAGGRWDAMTYVPISDIRAEERGFNQSAAMAEYVSKRYGIPLHSLLKRTRHTEKMSFKTRTQRLRDAQGLFAPREAGFQELRANHPLHIGEKAMNILLVDDIFTTGSTADACSKALQAGARLLDTEACIYVLTWARS
ncbi:hypothetical protein B1748_18630 [Paenibacillus sp. MY03]|uniref:ComF family protein n=1 Tax=Paenibacillus sp. MY03 TaxID=302980 RepID=UPI000B3CB24F|nr:ComF family protein [Paenibacillus sp. MY03]OUS75155.1 hypothetical protein B1748_18630 [Paenibacillus sp. MY03]